MLLLGVSSKKLANLYLSLSNNSFLEPRLSKYYSAKDVFSTQTEMFRLSSEGNAPGDCLVLYNHPSYSIKKFSDYFRIFVDVRLKAWVRRTLTLFPCIIFFILTIFF